MKIEQLQCDVVHVFDSGDFVILQEFEAVFRDFRTEIAARIKDGNVHEREYTKKQTVAMEDVSKFEQEMETVKSEQDKMVLQKKITDKKKSYLMIKYQELQIEVDKMKVERDNLSLQNTVDELALQGRREKKKNAWNAIKKACKVYKETLNIHIKLLKTEIDCECVKVSFFTTDDRKSDKFHMCLQQKENHWRVEKIQPTLSEEETNELKSIVDFSKQMTASDIITLLCNLRHIFIKYYTNIK